MQIKNFYYSFPTTYYFGENAIKNLEIILPNLAKKILVISGKNSAKRLGIIDNLNLILEKLKISFITYQNCPSNPSTKIVDEVVNIIKNENIDLIIAIGGGSVIDTAKACIYALKDKKNILLGTILTNPSSGSESNRSFVIYNEELKNKIAKADSCVVPNFAICDYEYTKTLSQKQINCSLSDIMAHLLEQFFIKEDWNFIDDLIVATIKSLVRITKILREDKENILAKQELMLISSFSLSYFLSIGRTMDWIAHTIEHSISGKYKTNHAEGMSIIMPKWIKFSMNNERYKYRLEKLAIELGINGYDDFAFAGYKFIVEYFYDLNLKNNFSELIPQNIDILELSNIIYNNNNVIGRVNILEKEQGIKLLESIFN